MGYYNNNNFQSAIPHLERAVMIYPKQIGRFHLILGEMYFKNGNKSKAEYYAQKALEINSNHEAPYKLLHQINLDKKTDNN